MLFHDLDERVVAAHEAGAAHPTDLGVGECHAIGPHMLGAGTVDEGVECALDFAVSAVAAEHTPVGRAGKHDVQLVVDVRIRADSGKSGDQTLHAPQHEARL